MSRTSSSLLIIFEEKIGADQTTSGEEIIEGDPTTCGLEVV